VWQSLWLSSFFGLQPQDKPDLHNQIFSLIFHSRGGFTHSEVYNMPTYLRFYYIKRLEKEYQDEKEEYNKQKKKRTPTKVKRPPKYKR